MGPSNTGSLAGGSRRGRSGFGVEGEFEGCASRSSLPMSMLTKPAPQGLLITAYVIILPATL
eukprot:480094-Pelagomonas_calceolata.AAC.2